MQQGVKLALPWARKEKEGMNGGGKTGEGKEEKEEGRRRKEQWWEEGQTLLVSKRNNKLNTVQSIKIPPHYCIDLVSP